MRRILYNLIFLSLGLVIHLNDTLEPQVNEFNLGKPPTQEQINLIAIENSANLHGIPPEYLYGLCMRESSLNEKALGDGKKAFGLCQIHYRTAKHMGFEGRPDELFDPYINTTFAAKYVKFCRKFYRSWKHAMDCYRRGPYGAKKRYSLSPNDLGPYVDDIFEYAKDYPVEKWSVASL